MDSNFKRMKIHQVDAFTGELFHGNPAAVCIPDEWPGDETMQKIGTENNLSETAFAVKKGDAYGIRWFTPAVEVELCGHATLATAHVLYSHYNYPSGEIIFETRFRGKLKVTREGEYLVLDFPADTIEKAELPGGLAKALGCRPQEVYMGTTDYLLIYPSRQDIESIYPDFRALSELDVRGLIVSAPGTETDFVSRFFAPGSGIDEDPVTGSAHTTLTPYWSRRLGKQTLTARQVSSRGGDLVCEMRGDRVLIKGKAVTYMEGEIRYPG
jgi:PhzF family phenazine biosynthesis protein